MVASLCGLRELIRRDPAPYRNLVHYFTNILKQVGQLPAHLVRSLLMGCSWQRPAAPALRHSQAAAPKLLIAPCVPSRPCPAWSALLRACPSPPSLCSAHPPPPLQAAEGKLGRAYEYHRAPAPFVQLELLRLLGMLGAGDRSASENMYAVVAEVKRRAEPLGNNIGAGGPGLRGSPACMRRSARAWRRRVSLTFEPSGRIAPPQLVFGHAPNPPNCPPTHPPGNALVYECIRTLTRIVPTPVLVNGAVESVSRLLASRENNLKYAGIDALTRLVEVDPKHAQAGSPRRAGAALALAACMRGSPGGWRVAPLPGYAVLA